MSRAQYAIGNTTMNDFTKSCCLTVKRFDSKVIKDSTIIYVILDVTLQR